jgi:putative ABC transport system substrate-binding protein
MEAEKMKKIAHISLVITVVAFVFSGVFVHEARAEKKIGVLLWNDEPRYAESNAGIMEQLKKEGFGEPKVSFTVENAGGNKVKAMELARKLAAARYDMVIAVGTSAAVAVAKEVKDVPVIFSMVFDPIDSKIADSWNSSGNNTTGASPRVPMEQLLENLKKLAPIKTLAVLYTPGEKNSEIQLKEVQAASMGLKIKILPVPVSNKEGIAAMLSEVLSRAEAVYLTGSNVVGDSLSTIVNNATRAKVITISHLSDHVEKGVLLGVCADPRAVGRLAGTKAAKVLKGAKPSSLPIEMVSRFEVIVNMKTAKEGKIEVPEAFLKSATQVIQ